MTAWDTSCVDWRQRIVAGDSLIPVLPLYEPRAEKALRIFKRLRLVKVRGEPTMGEACAPWVFEWVRAIFGAYDPIVRRQVIRESLLLISKKNGKSSCAAAIMLTALIMNDVREGEYLIAAPTKDIADNSFEPARAMVEADAALLKRFKPSQISRTIENRLDGSALNVKAADAEAVGGQNAITVLIDELWLFGKRASAENTLSEATGSLVSQPEGFVLYLTTQSDDQPAGVFLKKLRYYRGVRDGKIPDTTALPVLFEFPEEMQTSGAWRDPATWYITNPSLGRSVDMQWLRSEYAKKEIDGADSLRLFAAKHLNVEVGVGLKTDAWPGAEIWETAADASICGDLDNLLGRSEVVVVGIDGGGLDDLLGLAVIGRERISHRWLVWNRAWATEKVLERRKSEAPRLRGFAQADEIEIVAEVGPDIEALADIVQRIGDAGLLAEENAVGLDPQGIGQIVDALHDRRIEEKQITGVSQGYRLNGAILTTERKLADHTLVHAGQRLMDWCVGNAKVELKGNAVLVTKAVSGKGKIDPLAATFNAVDLMSRGPAARRSAYETRRLLVL